ncbi:MAG: hypothetical protein ACSHX6_04225 [Akkermansiaceae bacterium]
MKLKYIFSMVAGLIVMTAISCSEKTTTDTDAGNTATAKSSEAAASSSNVQSVVGNTAYYVMFKGDGS